MVFTGRRNAGKLMCLDYRGITMNKKVILTLLICSFAIHASDKFDFYLLPGIGTEFASMSHSYKNPQYTEIAHLSYLKPQLNAKLCFYLNRLVTVSFIDKMSFLGNGRDSYTNNLHSKGIMTVSMGVEITSRFKKDGPLYIGAFMGNNSTGDPDYKYSGFWTGILAGCDIKDIFMLDLAVSSTIFNQIPQIEDAAYVNSGYNRVINGPVNLREICIGLNIGYKFYTRNIKNSGARSEIQLHR
jgi:hypothetical protein